MTNTRIFAVVFNVICCVALSPLQRSRAGNDKFYLSRSPIPDRYIVVLEGDDDALTSSLVTAESGKLTDAYGGRTRAVFATTVKGFSVEMTELEARRLAEDPRVKYVEQDGVVTAEDTVIDPAWALDRIDQRTLPYDNQYSFNASGQGVNVYVLDSGVLTTHEALTGRAVDAFDAIHDTTPIENCNGHGTGVAGVVASSNYGTARGATIQSVRVLPCSGSGTVSDVISGVDWVTRHAVKPAVANMSIRSTYSRTMNSAISSSINSGVTYVVAAGNDSDNACNYSPSSVPEAITVGATNSADQRVYYSNFGSCVDIFAPGEGIKTIWNTTTTTVTFASGTSFASPYVAGTVALYLESNPLASPAEVASALIANSTDAVVTDPGVGSPNKFLYSLFGGGNPPGGCSATTFTGALGGPGYFDYKSDAAGFSTGQGTFSGTLNAPDGAVFSLSLEKKSRSRWSVVSSADSQVAYRGKCGTYRWRIDAISGSGTYLLCSSTP
jgi:subtilisin family serine protease